MAGDPREAASRAVLAAFHDLHPRIPSIKTGDCHCNLLAEIALDAVVPVLLTAGRRQAADAIRAAGMPAEELPPSNLVLLEREDAARIAEGSVSDD